MVCKASATASAHALFSTGREYQQCLPHGDNLRAAVAALIAGYETRDTDRLLAFDTDRYRALKILGHSRDPQAGSTWEEAQARITSRRK